MILSWGFSSAVKTSKLAGEPVDREGTVEGEGYGRQHWLLKRQIITWSSCNVSGQSSLHSIDLSCI